MKDQKETIIKNENDKSSYTKPVDFDDLTTEQFDAIINESLNDYLEGKVYTIEEVKAHLDEILKQ